MQYTGYDLLCWQVSTLHLCLPHSLPAWSCMSGADDGVLTVLDRRNTRCLHRPSSFPPSLPQLIDLYHIIPAHLSAASSSVSLQCELSWKWAKTTRLASFREHNELWSPCYCSCDLVCVHVQVMASVWCGGVMVMVSHLQNSLQLTSLSGPGSEPVTSACMSSGYVYSSCRDGTVRSYSLL